MGAADQEVVLCRLINMSNALHVVDYSWFKYYSI